MLLGGIELEKPMTQSQVQEHPLRNGAREDEIRSVGGVGSNASEEARPKWAKFCTHVVQGMAKVWALGCVIPPLAAGRVSRTVL